MLLGIKTVIQQLAKNAVIVAETELKTGTGFQKKQKAIDYIISNLPCSALLKNIISIFLSSFIDNSVEAAVLYMNSISEIKEKK